MIGKEAHRKRRRPDRRTSRADRAVYFCADSRADSADSRADGYLVVVFGQGRKCYQKAVIVSISGKTSQTCMINSSFEVFSDSFEQFEAPRSNSVQFSLLLS